MEQITGKLSSLMNGTKDQAKKLETVELPPGKPGAPYVISSQDGEIIYIPLSKSATRLLITGKETEDAFCVVASGGSQGDPIGFHYHREAHDVFLCLQGNINVWAGEKCRTMGAGDFASLPPGTIHQYQVLGAHAEMVGLIVPGGWEEFFRFIGEPYSGPMWPMDDNRNFLEVLLPKLKAAAEQYDMVPCPQQEHFEPQEWQADENQLPGSPQPYFLKNASGPAYEVGGTVCRPIITTAESHGKFAIGSIEGSSQHHKHGIFAKEVQCLRFDNVHHAFYVVQGSVEFHLDSSSPSKLAAGEVIYIPKGTAFRYKMASRHNKVYAFANGGGLIEVLSKLGKEHKSPILPEKAEDANVGAFKTLQPEFGFSFS
ncbi:Uu.00g052100.m01.CDS01 [Anthostomella pinea]|uniref:Uu.00g052100.m01.CDS01 n=1 Tax=Anthostomella pinea TaxID=933095 RepID=A0AAI8VX43_9PEZI|nr:Uu.00g052100.m01.CDS01 [Anthostomella pinea]